MSIASKRERTIVGLHSEGSSVKLQRSQQKPVLSTSQDKDTEISTENSSNDRKSSSTGRRGYLLGGNTYKTEPEVTFNANAVENIIQDVLKERLTNVKYEPVYCKVLSQELAGVMMERLKVLDIKRYKMVAVVSIGSLKERPGIQFGSRCLWNRDTDSFASVKFTNGSLFAVAMVYGMYFE